MDLDLKLVSDVVKYQAKIFLCTRGIESSTFLVTPLKLLSSLHPSLGHWLLYIEFDENKVVYVEGIEKGGKLLPEVKSIPKNTELSREPYTSKYLSPSELYKNVQKNSLNFTIYHPIYNNCQHWFREMIKLVEIQDDELPISTDQFAQRALYGFAALLGAGAAVWWLSKDSNDQKHGQRYITGSHEDSDSDSD